MSARVVMNRRTLLGAGVVAGAAGLVIAMNFSTDRVEAPLGKHAGDFAPNAYLRIAPDGRITLIIGQAELGQGTYTSLSQIIAEELDADWTHVAVEAAAPGPAFEIPDMPGVQVVEESRSVEYFYEPMRRAGAVGRALLIRAASRRWGVPESDCRTSDSFVHGPAGQKIAYGELAKAAAALPPIPPAEIRLKRPEDFKLIGTSVPRIEGPDKVRGMPIYGLDVDPPGMLTAVVARCPVLGGKVRSFDSSAAAKLPGVKKIFRILSGVVVLADNYWTARTARDLLRIEWDRGARASLSTEALQRHYGALARTRGKVVAQHGNVDRALNGHADVLTLEYSTPYQAHTPMEPLNCTMQLKGGRCNIWVGSQYQSIDLATAARILGISRDNVRFETTYIGGGFGRRASPTADVVAETAEIVKAARPLDLPIRNVWSREDDIRGGEYRPMTVNRISGAIRPDGRPLAWSHTVVSQSVLKGSEFESFIVDGADPMSTWGADDLAYDIPNFRVDLHTVDFGPTVSWMRGSGDFNTAFVVETFLDELAHKAGQDPLEYRLALIKDDPRPREVLRLAAEKSGWGTPLPAGSGRGIALHFYRATWVAHVAEVTVVDGRLRVDRITCAVDCGRVVNPDGARAQAEGGINFGLTCALYSKITFRDGEVEQANFDTYPLLRINTAPRIETFFIDRKDKPPSGMGEMTLPPVAPAICNALFAATGKRVRTLPLADVMEV